MVTVLYTAAHGGFAKEQVPLGGAGTVCNQLVEEWERTKPFELRLLNPSILGSSAPTGRDLVRFTTREYTDFCFEFERALQRKFFAPIRTILLCWRTTLRKGRISGVWRSVDLGFVRFITSISLRMSRPCTCVRCLLRKHWSAGLIGWSGFGFPRSRTLVFQKQRDSVMHSRGMIVPSEGMLDAMLRCYPSVAREKVHVIPWGVVPINEPAVPNLREEFGVPEDALCFLTLSRIAPEKGQDLLLEALVGWEKPLWLFICGEASYMYGERFLRRLKELAGRLRNVNVVFPGHVTGARKQAFFQMADVYVFPSRTESYGLTLLEAMYAGLPAVCLDHQGARAVMTPEFGEIVPASGLRGALERMAGDPERRSRQGAAARAFAKTQLFSNTAARLAQLLAATVRSKTSS